MSLWRIMMNTKQILTAICLFLLSQSVLASGGNNNNLREGEEGKQRRPTIKIVHQPDIMKQVQALINSRNTALEDVSRFLEGYSPQQKELYRLYLGMKTDPSEKLIAETHLTAVKELLVNMGKISELTKDPWTVNFNHFLTTGIDDLVSQIEVHTSINPTSESTDLRKSMAETAPTEIDWIFSVRLGTIRDLNKIKELLQGYTAKLSPKQSSPREKEKKKPTRSLSWSGGLGLKLSPRKKEAEIRTKEGGSPRGSRIMKASATISLGENTGGMKKLHRSSERLLTLERSSGAVLSPRKNKTIIDLRGATSPRKKEEHLYRIRYHSLSLLPPWQHR